MDTIQHIRDIKRMIRDVRRMRDQINAVKCKLRERMVERANLVCSEVCEGGE